MPLASPVAIPMLAFGNSRAHSLIWRRSVAASLKPCLVSGVFASWAMGKTWDIPLDEAQSVLEELRLATFRRSIGATLRGSQL